MFPRNGLVAKNHLIVSKRITKVKGGFDSNPPSNEERGEYIATVKNCGSRNRPLGNQGPKWEQYLAGGNNLILHVLSKYCNLRKYCLTV
jgi:hypothetical protein